MKPSERIVELIRERYCRRLGYDCGLEDPPLGEQGVYGLQAILEYLDEMHESNAKVDSGPEWQSYVVPTPKQGEVLEVLSNNGIQTQRFDADLVTGSRGRWCRGLLDICPGEAIRGKWRVLKPSDAETKDDEQGKPVMTETITWHRTSKGMPLVQPCGMLLLGREDRDGVIVWGGDKFDRSTWTLWAYMPTGPTGPTKK